MAKSRVLNEVSVYDEGHWVTDVVFRYKWQARLFHLILNQSLHSAGVRNY